MSDWASETRLRPNVIHITVDTEGTINHVGIGFAVVGPSGRVLAESGYTWSPGEHRQALDAAVRQLFADLVAAEGVSGMTFS